MVTTRRTKRPDGSDSEYVETKRVVRNLAGEVLVKVTTCCCAAPGSSRKGCSIVARNKTPCRCFCHSHETQEDWSARRRDRKAPGSATGGP